MERFKSAPLPKDNNRIRKVFSTVFLSSYPEKKNTILDCQNPQCMTQKYYPWVCNTVFPVSWPGMCSYIARKDLYCFLKTDSVREISFYSGM